MAKTLTLTDEQAVLLKQVLHAAFKTWRRYPGMNNGHSEIHNMYSEDIDTLIQIHDELEKEIGV